MPSKVDVMMLPATEVKGSLKWRLRKLTLHTGMMWGQFLESRENDKVFLARTSRRISGWCLVFDKDFEYHAYTFVDPRDRKQGVGISVFEHVNKTLGGERFHVYPWNVTSRKFYQKIYDKMPAINSGW